MNAIILAAGFGTRLGDLTKTTPKCLIEVSGKPMLQNVIERLIFFGVKEIVVNTHYLAAQVHEFVSGLNYPSCKIMLSNEHEILGTGGGIKQALTFFSAPQETFIYNADIYTDLDLNFLQKEHHQHQALVSIACKSMHTARHLLFNKSDLLVGWANDDTASKKIISNAGNESEIKSGHYLCVQLISPKIATYFSSFEGAFSIFDPYLAAAEAGEIIRAVWLNPQHWHDIGTPNDLEQARSETLKD